MLSRENLFLPDLVANAPSNNQLVDNKQLLLNKNNQLIRNQFNDSAAHTDESDEYESADEVHEPLCGNSIQIHLNDIF